MDRALVTFVGLCLLEVGRGFAQDSEVPEPPQPSPLRSLTPASGGESLDKTVDHLLKAADHLEAAGLPDEAAKVRNSARRRAVREDLLGRKESELECLQEEVDRLRALTGQAPGIRIEIVAVEIDRKALGLKARDFDKMIGFTAGQALDSSLESSGIHRTNQRQVETFGIVEANPSRLPLFKELVEKGALNVLARPTLVTSTGRPASLHIGGEVPVRIQSSSGEASVRSLPFGTHVEVLATVLPNHRVRVRMAFEKREINSEKTTGEDAISYPEVQTRRINTEVEVKFGQTVTLAGLTRQRRPESEAPGENAAGRGSGRGVARDIDASDNAQTMIFITPQLIHSPIAPRALHAVPEPVEEEDESSELIAPAVFEPVDGDVFGPPVPVLRRRTSRD